MLQRELTEKMCFSTRLEFLKLIHLPVCCPYKNVLYVKSGIITFVCKYVDFSYLYILVAGKIVV